MPANRLITLAVSKFARLSKVGVLLSLLVLANASFQWVQAEPTRVVFHGNRVFSSKELSKFLMVSDHDNLRSEALEQRLSSMIDSLVARDRVFARVDSVHFEKQANRTRVNVFLFEGPLAEVSEVHWLGDSARVVGIFSARAECQPGAVFRWGSLYRDAQLLLDYFEGVGYPFARVDIDSVVTNDKAGTVAVWMRLNSGPFMRVEFLSFEGNKHIAERHLIRDSRFKIGTPYSQSRVESARKRLARQEYLRNVAPPRIAADANGRNGVLFSVEEAPTTRIDAVAGYLPQSAGRKGGISGLVNLEFLNLFGTGRKGRVHWERPDNRVQEIELSFREPWVLGQPIGARFDFGQRIEDTLYVRRRLALRTDADLGSAFSVWGTLQREIVIADSASSRALSLPNNRTTYLESGLQLDTRDSRTNPRSGVYFSTYAGSGWRESESIADSMRGGNHRQQRAGVDCDVAQEIRPLWVADVSAYARILGTTEPEYLLSDLYRLGGARTLRGYREEQFRGTRIGWGSVELRYLLAASSRVFVFYDLGAVYRKPKSQPIDGKSTLVKSGAGLGLRIESQIGIWGLDYGIGEKDRLLNGKLHVSLLGLF